MKRQSLTPDMVDRLTMNVDPWMSCDDCFDQMDEIVETLLTTTSAIPEHFRVHLRSCPACYDETATLVALTAPEYGATPGTVLEKFDRPIQRG